jgi:hypothetical protein
MAGHAPTADLAEARDGLRRHDAASLEAREEWRRALAQLGKFDQDHAKLRDELLASVLGMADCVVVAGKALIKGVVLHAEQEQLYTRLDAAWSASSSEEEKSAIAALLVSRDRNSLNHVDAHQFVKECAWHIASCLEWLDECLANDEFDLARAIGQQARRITIAMREVYNAWPWTDEEAIEASWKQYRQGQLMDFETFKHELLKAAQ